MKTSPIFPLPNDKEYLMRLATALYGVAYTEWAVLGFLPSLLEKGLLPITRDEAGKIYGMTTHNIAEKLKKLSKQTNDVQVSKWLSVASDNLSSLVDERNDIIHSRPCTDENKNDQSLYRYCVKDDKVKSFMIDNEYLDKFIGKINTALREISSIDGAIRQKTV